MDGTYTQDQDSMQEDREFRIDIGDIELSVVEWLGEGDPILLLHATGFHSRCWYEVVKDLPGRHIYAVDLRFHGKSGDAGEVAWKVMAEDIRILVEQLELSNILGVGHSIGGHLLTRVAAQRPDLFQRLVLIDPVIQSPERYEFFREHLSDLGAADHPVSKRKNNWRDAEEMFERFKGKEPFSTWRPEVLRDYCDYALSPAGDDDFQTLACDPINEAGIYMHQDGNEDILAMLPTIETPTLLLRAPPQEGDVPTFAASPTWPELAGILPNCKELYLPEHNHFIPMQDPELVARVIRGDAT